MLNLAELEERLADAKSVLQRLENAQAADYAAGIKATETDMVNAANAAEDVLFFEREVNAEREHQRGLAERRARVVEGETREEMKKARERLDDSEARSSLALKALMEVERR